MRTKISPAYSCLRGYTVSVRAISLYYHTVKDSIRCTVSEKLAKIRKKIASSKILTVQGDVILRLPSDHVRDLLLIVKYRFDGSCG